MDRYSAKPPSLRLCTADLYYVLFKHKRKILSFAVLGFLAAIILFSVWPTTYQAEAKLLVRYVMESKAPGPVNGENKIKTPDERGEAILNSEAEILTSRDVAMRVVAAIGSQRILPGSTNNLAAAAMVQRNIKVEIPTRSSVMRVTFRHPNPDLVQPVLSQLIESYLKVHTEVHRAIDLYDDFLSAETGQLASRLAQTEEELRKLKSGAGVLSVKESESAFTEQLSLIRQEMYSAEAELAERKAMLQQLGAMPEATDVVAAPDRAPLSSEIVAQYQSVRKVLDDLYLQEQQYRLKYTPENPTLKRVQSEIAMANESKKAMEEHYPSLAHVPVQVESANREGGREVLFDPMIEKARVMALESRIQALKQQLNKVRTEAAAIGQLEPQITELERKKQLQEAHYQYFSANLEQARIDGALRAGRFSNISVVQNPSPAEKYVGKLYPVLGGLLAGGLLIGLVLAWAVEGYLDQSVKRPMEVERRLGLPLFAYIPAFKQNGHRLPLKATKLLPGASEPSAENVSMEVVPWAVNHPMRSSLEIVRDRLIFYFEVKKLYRKPKLVGVTSCRKGAGASTVAAGLAATLSETGDGNVLLVDMNVEHTFPQLFQKGDRTFGLETVLNGDSREDAMVQDNLYAASSASDRFARVLPKNFKELIPRLKASDYDYIIFDFPPMGHNSTTPQLVHFMDMVLMIVEAEKNCPEVIKRSSAAIKESKSKLAIVLNKTREYVPHALTE